jgi:hypothetical protein
LDRAYKTIILAIVFNGYQVWSPTLREECSLRVFKSRGLRKICDRRGRHYYQEVAEKGWAGMQTWVEVGKREGKRPYKRLRPRCKDNLKWMLKEIGLVDVD